MPVAILANIQSRSSFQTGETIATHWFGCDAPGSIRYDIRFPFSVIPMIA
jgi:hypothetical protein